MRYAYLDEFAVESEHVLGLKYRVEKQFLIYLIYRKEEMHGYKFC